MAGGRVWQEGVYGRGGHAWQGACMAGGVHGRGHAWQGGLEWWGTCMVGGAWIAGGVWWEACMAGETATAAGGTHHTGMHSCYKCFSGAIHTIFEKHHVTWMGL